MAGYFKQEEDDYFEQRPEWLMRVLAAGSGNTRNPMFVMGPSTEENWDAPAAVVFQIPPNFVVPRHAHDCFRFEVIVDGRLTVENGDVLVAGDVMTAVPGEFYGPHVAGPEGCTTVEVFSSLEGGYQLITETPDGAVRHDGRVGGPNPLPPFQRKHPVR